MTANIKNCEIPIKICQDEIGCLPLAEKLGAGSTDISKAVIHEHHAAEKQQTFFQANGKSDGGLSGTKTGKVTHKKGGGDNAFTTYSATGENRAKAILWIGDANPVLFKIETPPSAFR